MPKETQNMMSFGKRVIAQEGLVNGLWKPGFWGHSLGIGMSAIGRVGMYPFVRDFMLKISGAKEGEKPKSVMIAAGFLSGAAGYLLCCPIYQVKTLSQAEAGLVGSDGTFLTGTRVG
jgi:hypothetical protein